MRQHFTIAPAPSAALCAVLSHSGAGRTRGGAGASQPRRQRAVELHGAKRRHAVGHLRQVPQGPVALAGRVADEPRADPQPAPDLPGRRHQPDDGRRPAAARAARNTVRTVAGSAGVAARSRGDPGDPAGRHRAVPDAPADHRTRRPRRSGRDRRRTRRARRPRPDRRRLRRRHRPEGRRPLVHLPARREARQRQRRDARLREPLPRHRARRALRRRLDGAHRVGDARKSSSATGCCRRAREIDPELRAARAGPRDRRPHPQARPRRHRRPAAATSSRSTRARSDGLEVGPRARASTASSRRFATGGRMPAASRRRCSRTSTRRPSTRRRAT